MARNEHRKVFRIFKDRICYLIIWASSDHKWTKIFFKEFFVLYCCIDLVLTSRLKLVLDSGVHPSLHPNCHHQIVYAKFNLKIHYSPLYEREIWHYWQGNTGLIRRAVHKFNWQRAFRNLNKNERVPLFIKPFWI